MEERSGEREEKREKVQLLKHLEFQILLIRKKLNATEEYKNKTQSTN